VANAADNRPKRPCGEELVASRREEILEQAAVLFARHGYSETDTQSLAETLGCGKGTVYRYFSSKRELFLATADRVMRQLRGRIDASIVDVDEPLEQIRVAIRAFLSFFAEHPEFVELLIQERAQFKDRKKPTFIEHREANVRRWQELYRSLMGQGRIRVMPAERISDVVSHLLYGTIFMNYFSGEPTSVDEQTRDIIDVMYNGILTPQERERQAAASAASGGPDAGSPASLAAVESNGQGDTK
jgi:AcrR family transcriptional regulator